MPRPVDSPPRLIARQLALGFAAVSVVAIVMCGMFLVLIHDVSEHVAQMRRDETAIRQGLELAASVRELSLHAGQAIMDPEPRRLVEYREARNSMRKRIQELAPRISNSERWRLQALGRKTQRLHDVLTAVAIPAARRGDDDAARQAYAEVLRAGHQASAQADSLARATTARMAHAHDLATNTTRIGFLGGGLCVALVLALSLAFTLRLRAAVLHPLVILTQAAQRFGRGDLQERVPPLGRGELAALGEAMNTMADELAQREKRLVHNERMAAIGQLAAGVAHEMNNPIGIMRGYLKTMSVNEDKATLREEFSILDEEAGHCERIAGDLLSYARSHELTLEGLSLPEFVNQAARRFAETSEGSQQQIEMDVEPAQIRADGAKLRQVLLNLLVNASQAAPRGRVWVRGWRSGEQYFFEVEDEGPGIAPEDRERIFEPFFTRRRGGSGLGLSVCQGILQAHDGSIEARDGKHGGAVFMVCLPMRGPESPTERLVTGTTTSGGATAGSATGKIATQEET